MAFGSWLINELNRRDITQSDLSRAIGRSTATVSRWVSEQDSPTLENVRAIARTLAIDVRTVAREAGIDLPGAEPEPRSAEDILAELEANQPVAVPVISDLVAHMGNGGGFVEDFVYLPPRFRRGRRKSIRCIIATGECMSPLIEPGDYIIFDIEASWGKGDIVVATVDGTVQVKRLVEADKRYVLRGDGDGSTVTLSSDDRIIGKVLMFTRPLDGVV